MSRHYLSGPLRFTLKFLRIGRNPKVGFRILLFHDIPAGSVDVFEKLVSYVVSAHGALTPEIAAAVVEGNYPDDVQSGNWKMPCLFSFDDGFYSNLQIAETVLERYGIKALFFVAPGLIDLPRSEHRSAIAKYIFRSRIRSEKLGSDLRFMNWEELLKLKALGHVIGCHGLFHRRLTQLKGSDLYREVVCAGDMLDKQLNQKTNWYAYAFGDIGSIHEEALHLILNRYQYCRSGLRGANDFQTGRAAICADSLSLDSSLYYQKLLLEGGLDFLYWTRRAELITMTASR